MDGVDEIVREFLVESYENLDQLDADLVALERSPGSRELLASIFRTIHTIKGTSGFLAFGRLEALTHTGENLLAELRDGRRTMDQASTDVLLRMVDTIRALLGTIEATGAEGDVDVDPVVAALRAVLEGTTVAAADDDAATPRPTAPSDDVTPTPAADAPPTKPRTPRPPRLARPARGAPAPAARAAPGRSAGAAAPTPAPAAEAPEAPEPPVGTERADAAEGALAVPAADADWTPTFAFDAAAASAPDADDAAPPPPHPAPPADAEATSAPADPADAAPAPAAPAAAPAPAPGSDPASDAPATRSAADAAIRVDVGLLDALMRQVSELVLARNAIARLVEGDARTDLIRASQRLSVVAAELQEGVMKTRMQPIEHVWSKMPRMVRDVAASCGRQVRLDMSGGDTELDRSLLEAIKDPLTHLVRNAVDHGIEPPAFRTANGKPATGVLGLRAYHAGGQVVVEVTDDGAGINPDRIGATAVRKGLKTQEQVAAMAPAELLRLLFLPGFSTASSVTNVSGRGVGMDVVRTRIEGIGGTVDVESTVGRGTTWRMRIPLTLAIMPAVLVACGGETYALPQSSLLELVALDEPERLVEHVRGAPVYRLRGDLLPLADLREVLEVAPRPDGTGVVVAVLQTDEARFGLVVDRVLDSEEIVVKPLAAQLKAAGVYAGATLLGDGGVSLILDVPGLVRRALTVELDDTDVRAARHDATSAQTDQMLVVGLGEDRRVALPLSAVTRLEKLPAAVVEVVGGREVVQYRGTITPLVHLARVLGIGAAADDELTVVVATRGTRSVALAVSEIVDIVEDDGVQRSDVGGSALLGSTVLRDRVTELLDVRAVLTSADPAFYDEPAERAADLVGV